MVFKLICMFFFSDIQRKDWDRGMTLAGIIIGVIVLIAIFIAAFVMSK